MPEAQVILSVSQFLSSLNELLGEIPATIIGEVISIKIATSGHAYFTLKDKQNDAVIECVMWAYQYRINGVQLAPGMEIMVSGAANIYLPQGRLSFIAKTLTPVGEGALKKAYEELKRILTIEGLFAEERKRPLPSFPQRIGVITSKQGAVIHDFANNLGKRGFCIRFADSHVEGKEALFDVLQAIEILSNEQLDVLVIMRGGGSLQSLAAFDNEAIVRAIAGFPVPVIAAIGHHQDVPLTALAADIAVSTPTAAAALVSSSWDQAEFTLQRTSQTILNKYTQLLTDNSLTVLWNERIIRSFSYVIQFYKAELSHCKQIISMRNPLNILQHGYSIVRRGNVLVKHIKDAKIGETIEVLFSDGQLISRVEEIFEAVEKKIV